MKKYQVLINKSLNLSKKDYNLLPKMCYNNVFNYFSLNYSKFIFGEYKICYGFFISKKFSLGFRHAFVLDVKKNKIIDPTLKFFYKKGDKIIYYIFKEFCNIEEYFEMINKEKYPALYKCLEKNQLNFQHKYIEPEFNFITDIIPIKQ